MKMIGHQRVCEDVDERLVAILVLENFGKAVAFESLGGVLRENVTHHDVIVRVVQIEEQKKPLMVFIRGKYRELVGTAIVYVIVLAFGEYLTPKMHEKNYTRRKAGG